MRSEGFLQSLPLMCPTLALQNVDGTPEKEAGKYKSCHFFRWCSIVPWCMLLPHLQNNRLVERIVIIITVTAIIYWLFYENLVCLLFPSEGMLALKDAILEVCLYQENANICHSPDLSVVLSLLNPLGEQTEVSGITAARPVKASVLSCICSLSHGLVWLGYDGAV